MLEKLNAVMHYELFSDLNPKEVSVLNQLAFSVAMCITFVVSCSIWGWPF